MKEAGCPILAAAKRVGHLAQRRSAAKALRELGLQSVRGAQLLGSAGRQVHGSQMFGGSRAYEGTDPEQGVGGESVTPRMVEPLDGVISPMIGYLPVPVAYLYSR